jgi:hypothetical protein
MLADLDRLATPWHWRNEDLTQVPAWIAGLLSLQENVDSRDFALGRSYGGGGPFVVNTP